LRQNTGKHSTVGVGRNVIVAHVKWCRRGSAYRQVARASEVEITLGGNRAQGESVIIMGHQRMLKISDTGSSASLVLLRQQAQS